MIVLFPSYLMSNAVALNAPNLRRDNYPACARVPKPQELRRLVVLPDYYKVGTNLTLISLLGTKSVRKKIT